MRSILTTLLATVCFATAYAASSVATPLRTPEKSACPAWGDLVRIDYDVNLTQLKDDKLTIRMEVPPHKNHSLIFCMPKIVPGIYSALDFGNLVEGFRAVDARGEELETVRLDQNRCKIKKAHLLKVIVYEVNDGWEQFDIDHEGMYLSASSAFRWNEAFVINNNALFGYLERYEQNPIMVTVTKPVGMKGFTALRQTFSSETTDHFTAQNYRELVDQPMLYCKTEAARFDLDGVAVTIAMYSSTGKSLAGEIAAYIEPLMEHQKHYLGGELPVSNYMFLLYHNESQDKRRARGDGLEHGNSTLILMCTDFDPEKIKWNVYGIASHEFFHTIVPLGLHSEEIGDYNFNEPKLSEHLWLYEGLTEYFTIHMPVCEKLITAEEFLGSVEAKLVQTQSYKHERSLTWLSTHAMEQQDQYMDFYCKGTLANLCLDIRLRELSGGSYGVQLMTTDLMKEYGPYRSFEDDELFDEIARVSGQPEIRGFFKAFVEGTEPLPLKEYFGKVGIVYDEATQELSIAENPTDSQLALRKAWIGQ
jgi:predicted metalloprotease with PDZ domain